MYTTRDAWGYGAVDASSGTAALMEMVRTFGSLVRAGWRPRRTIGSTEDRGQKRREGVHR